MSEPRPTDTHLLLARSLFPRLECRRYLEQRTYRTEIDSLVKDLSVGGFVLFDGNVDEVFRTTEGLRNLSGDSLTFAADCEDGVTMRFTGGTEFPSMRALGAAGDVSATYSVARSIAREMRAIGLHWNYAPVADVNSNPANPIINTRSFGDEPLLVADHVHAYIRGMQDGGVAACAKHFPGHGDTSTDSHLDVVVIPGDRRRLDNVELPPFREAMRQGVMSVMVGHISSEALDPGSSLPATLSSVVVTDLLRKEFAYEGVIVTDALDMSAIAGRYPDGEGSLRAYRAGCDVLCIPEDPRAAFAALRGAAEAGEIKTRRIKATAGRIAAMKKWSDGFGDSTPLIDTARRGHDLIALEAARRSLQVVGRMRRVIPPLTVLAIVDVADSPKPQEWFDFFASWYPGEASGVVVTPEMDESDRAEILKNISLSGTVALALFVKPRGFAGSVGFSADQEVIVNAALERPTILLNFGNPYLLADAEPNVRIDGFSSSTATLAASIEALSRTVR